MCVFALSIKKYLCKYTLNLKTRCGVLHLLCPDVVESTNGGAGDGNHVWAAWSLLLTPRRPAPIIMPYDIGLISCGF